MTHIKIRYKIARRMLNEGNHVSRISVWIEKLNYRFIRYHLSGEYYTQLLTS